MEPSKVSLVISDNPIGQLQYYKTELDKLKETHPDLEKDKSYLRQRFDLIYDATKSAEEWSKKNPSFGNLEDVYKHYYSVLGLELLRRTVPITEKQRRKLLELDNAIESASNKLLKDPQGKYYIGHFLGYIDSKEDE